VVWRIDARGIAHVIVGSGGIGDGTERSALDLRLQRPEGLAVARDGSLFLSDGYLHVVFRIAPDGRVERFAGTGEAGDSGDDGPASGAQLFRPADLRLDRDGNLFIADVRNHRVRRVDPSGRISTVAGTGVQGFSPDGTPATEARLDMPWGIGLDLEQRLLIGDGGNHRVRRVESDGRLVTLAGNGRQGYAGDGGPATEARLNFPEGLFVDPHGTLFIGDEWNNAVRMVDARGIISTVMGTGFPGRAQLGGTAHVSPLDDPENVLSTPEGLIVSDGNNGRVIRISREGIVELVAGMGTTESCSPLR
jgi:sugar lactone lactonase YvrE